MTTRRPGDRAMSRRTFVSSSSVGLLAASLATGGCRADGAPATDDAMVPDAAGPDAAVSTDGAPPAGGGIEIAMLAYPGMTPLDLIGPHQIWARMPGVRVHLVWKRLEPIVGDSGLAILPTTTFADCPAQLDVLFVGGSFAATWPLMSDAETLDFLTSRGQAARFVTSVCTGSLLLGAAGLLCGYQATSHWAVRHVLPDLGAIRSDERVVIDRNRITGAGVTAGLDFGLRVIEALGGTDLAQVAQLFTEYDPEPPFDAGSPATAPAPILALVTALYAEEVARAEAAGRAARSCPAG